MWHLSQHIKGKYYIDVYNISLAVEYEMQITYIHTAYGYFSSDTFTYLCYKAVNFIMFLPAKVYYCMYPCLGCVECCFANRYVCYAYLQYKASIILVLQLIYIQYGGPEPAVHFLLCIICIAHITSCHQNLSPLAKTTNTA